MHWKDEVYSVLRTIPNATACFNYPAEWPKGTVITYAGLDDTPGTNADDDEYTTNITVKVDVWDFNPVTVKDIVEQVKQKMKSVGFVRTFCYDMFETSSRLHHTTMRYRRNQ